MGYIRSTVGYDRGPRGLRGTSGFALFLDFLGVTDDLSCNWTIFQSQIQLYSFKRRNPCSTTVVGVLKSRSPAALAMLVPGLQLPLSERHGLDLWTFKPQGFLSTSIFTPFAFSSSNQLRVAQSL